MYLWHATWINTDKLEVHCFLDQVMVQFWTELMSGGSDLYTTQNGQNKIYSLGSDVCSCLSSNSGEITATNSHICLICNFNMPFNLFYFYIYPRWALHNEIKWWLWKCSHSFCLTDSEMFQVVGQAISQLHGRKKFRNYPELYMLQALK